MRTVLSSTGLQLLTCGQTNDQERDHAFRGSTCCQAPITDHRLPLRSSAKKLLAASSSSSSPGKQNMQLLLHRIPCFFTVLLLVLTQLTVPGSSADVTAAGTCLSVTGVPICCKGKQVTCYGYQKGSINNISNTVKHVRQKSLPVSLIAKTNRPNCFCDEHCTETKDCCPDYRIVCQKPVIDCVVSNWGEWDKCSRQCGLGWTTRRRQAVRPAHNGGRHCPVLEEKKRCEGDHCPTRRVGRSGFLAVPLLHQARAEVAHLLPLLGDVLRMTRRYDMRWDVRRKLYLGRLIKQNKTEKVDPDPYCAVYEITHTNPSCRLQTMLQQMQQYRKQRMQRSSHYPWRPVNSGSVYTFSRPTENKPAFPYGEHSRSSPHQYYDRDFDSASSLRIGSDWGLSDQWSYSWMSHAPLLMEGHRICVTCYPAYMREDLGYRCTGTGLLNFETRWRALRTTDCHGRLRMVSIPRRACTCSDEAASFIFV